MGTPNPRSRASAVLRVVRRKPRTIAEIAAALGCTTTEAAAAFYSLERHDRIRRAYPRGGGDWIALMPRARTPDGYLDAPGVDSGESPSLSAKALLTHAMALRGVSQGDLERATGIGQPHISAMLSESAGEPRWATVAKLLEAMGYALELVDMREVAASE